MEKDYTNKTDESFVEDGKAKEEAFIDSFKDDKDDDIVDLSITPEETRIKNIFGKYSKEGKFGISLAKSDSSFYVDRKGGIEGTNLFKIKAVLDKNNEYLICKEYLSTDFVENCVDNSNIKKMSLSLFNFKIKYLYEMWGDGFERGL